MKTLALMIALGVSHGADAYFTNHDLNNRRFHESNPLARPFVTNTTNNAVWSTVNFGVVLLAVGALHRRHHDKLANAIAIGDIAGHTWGTAHSVIYGRP